jgi:hypothetical protein
MADQMELGIDKPYRGVFRKLLDIVFAKTRRLKCCKINSGEFLGYGDPA